MYERFRGLQHQSEQTIGRVGSPHRAARTADLQLHEQLFVLHAEHRQRDFAGHRGQVDTAPRTLLQPCRRQFQGHLEPRVQMGRQCQAHVRPGRGAEPAQLPGHRPDAEGLQHVDPHRHVRLDRLPRGSQGRRGHQHPAYRLAARGLYGHAGGTRAGQLALQRQPGAGRPHQGRHLRRRHRQVAEIHQHAAPASADARERP